MFKNETFFSYFQTLCSDKQNVSFLMDRRRPQAAIFDNVTHGLNQLLHCIFFHATRCWCWRPKEGLSFLDAHWYKTQYLDLKKATKVRFLYHCVSSLVKEFDHRSRTWLKGHFEATTTHTLLLTRFGLGRGRVALTISDLVLDKDQFSVQEQKKKVQD